MRWYWRLYRNWPRRPPIFFVGLALFATVYLVILALIIAH